jgi:long-chain acyl-CoA synthetase
MTDAGAGYLLDAAMLANCGREPGRVAFQDDHGPLDARTFAGMSAALGQRLGAMTAAPSVAICLPGITLYPVAVFATLLAGKTAVPINFLLQPRELLHIFKDCGADTVITCSYFKDKLAPLGLKLIVLDEQRELLAPPPDMRPGPAAEPRDTAVLIYTSGTTALPKGVMLTHANIRHQMDALGGTFDLGNFHLFSALPMFHSFALCTCVFLPALTRARVSLMPVFDPSHAVEAIRKFKANVILGVPSMYRGIMRAAARHSLDGPAIGLQIAVAGGEKLPNEVREAWETSMHLPLYEGFGMTEHGPAISVNTPSNNRPGSIGKPLPGVEWRVVDGDGKSLPTGQEGELQIRSPSVMAGYHNQTEQPFTADGWLKTGDLARLDADGFGFITGRIKELIISAGENIHPAEIEDVLAKHPAVEECAAIGVHDKTRGEAPVCFAVLKQGQAAEPDALRDWCRGKLADYKVPRQVRIVASLPHTPTGKVFRRGLKALLDAGEAKH